MAARLTRLDWLDHGLAVLAASGPAALKAEPLAKSLNVSRGSFYWHFPDIGRFQAELLARWRERTTDSVILAIDRMRSPDAQLARLMRAALTSDDALERGVRSWAAQDAAVAKAVAEVDAARLRYLSKLLKARGVSDEASYARAIFVYWAYIGRVMVGDGAGRIPEAEIVSIAGLLRPGDRQS